MRIGFPQYFFCMLLMSAALRGQSQADSTACESPAAQNDIRILMKKSFSKDSLTVIDHVETETAFANPFSMTPEVPVRSHWLTRPWVQTGLAALITGVSGYLIRKEADRTYSSYLAADTPEKMNHYFDRAVFYDKLSSGLFIVCEMNVMISMWFSVREVRSD